MNRVQGLCWHIPSIELYEKFQAAGKKTQLLVVQPCIGGMFFSANEKHSCYTAFFQNSPQKYYFKYHDFLRAHALPGAASYVTCIIQFHGPDGPTKFLTLEKSTALSEIPGLAYDYNIVANVPMPISWEKRKLTPAALQSIQLLHINEAIFDPRNPQSADEIYDELDARLHPLYDFCERFEVFSPLGLAHADPEIRLLLDDHYLRPQILKYLYWRKVMNTAPGEVIPRIYADQ